MSQSVWNFTDNLGISNNKFIKLTDQNLISRDIFGLDTVGNVIINSGNGDIYINSNSNGSYTYLNKNNTAGILINSQLGVGINNTSNMISNIVLPNNGWIGLNTTQGNHNGFLSIAGSSSLLNTTGSKIMLYGVDNTSGNGGDVQLYVGGSIGNIKAYTGNNSLKFEILNSGTTNFQPDGSTIVLSLSNQETLITNQVIISNTTQTTNSSSGALIVYGGLGISGDTFINGNLNVNSNINFNSSQISTSYSSGSFYLYGGLGIECSIPATNQFNGGALSIAGGLALGQNAIMGGNITILNSNVSTDALSGSAILYGGLGISGQINLRTSQTPQIKITPTITGNETSIYFGYQNNYSTSGSWLVGQNIDSIGVGNFGINISGSSFITLNGNNSQIYINNYTNLSNTLDINASIKDLIKLNSKWSIGETNSNFQISRFTNGNFLNFILTSDQQTGNITIYGTENSISNLSGGSLTVNGGASVYKDIYIGGNINFVGTLIQNGLPYLGSQWTSISGNAISYTAGNVIISNQLSVGSIVTTDLTSGNINFTGNLYKNGTLYIGSGSGSSQWTSNSSNIYYAGPTTGNVGINTSSPIYQLDVNGVIHGTGLSITGTQDSLNSTTGQFVFNSLSLSNTADVNSITQGGALTISGGAAITKGLAIGGNLNLSGISTEISGTTTVGNSISVVTNVNNLIFPNVNIRSFNLYIQVQLLATTNLYALYTILGIQNSSGWSITSNYTGDNTGLVFTINSSTGQILYTSGTSAGWISTTLSYNYISYSISGNYIQSSPPTSGNYTVTQNLTVMGNTIMSNSVLSSGAFNAVNGIISNTNVTNLIFDPNVYRSFSIIMGVSLLRSSGGNFNSQYTIDGIQTDSGWFIYVTELGDSINLTFNIVSGTGQIQYSVSSSYTNFTSLIFTYSTTAIYIYGGTSVGFSGGIPSFSSIGNATITNATITNTLFTNLSVGNISVGNSYIVNTTIANSNFLTNISIGNSNLTNATITNTLFTNLTTSNLAIGNINMGIASIYSGSFLAANNQTIASNITGLNFINTNIRYFEITMTVNIITTVPSTLDAVYILKGNYTDSGWSFYQSNLGDNTGVIFTLTTSGGQIQYTSTNVSNWSSTTFRYTVKQFSNTGTYSTLTNSQGSYIIQDLQINDTTDSIPGISNGALFILGGSTFNKQVNILATSNVTGVGSGGSLTVFGGLSVSKDIMTGGGGTFGGHLIPVTTITSNLGSSTNIWNTFYGNFVTCSTISISGTTNTSVISTSNVWISGNLAVGTNINTGGFISTSFANLSYNSNTVGSLYTTGGNVGIGIIPSSSLHIYNSNGNNLLLQSNNASTSATLTLSTPTLIGYIGLGGGSISAINYVNNLFYQSPNSHIWNYNTTSVMSLTNSGTLTVTGDVGAFGTISDARLKTNVNKINSGLLIVNNLNPVTFNWKDDIFNEHYAGKNDSGFIAQEVETVLPHAVGEYTNISNNFKYKNMRHERIIPYLVSAIQELTKKINILENNI